MKQRCKLTVSELKDRLPPVMQSRDVVVMFQTIKMVTNEVVEFKMFLRQRMRIDLRKNPDSQGLRAPKPLKTKTKEQLRTLTRLKRDREIVSVVLESRKIQTRLPELLPKEMKRRPQTPDHPEPLKNRVNTKKNRKNSEVKMPINNLDVLVNLVSLVKT